MSLLSHVKDKNGNTLKPREATRTTKEPTELQEIIRRDINKLISDRVKKDGVKVDATITQLKTKTTKQLNDTFVIMSGANKPQKIGKNNDVGVPFFTEYRFKLFIDETNITEEYTEVGENGDEVLHVAKDELKENAKK